MTRSRRSVGEQSPGEAVRGLAIAALAGSSAFHVEMRRYFARAIELRPVVTEPGAPSGLWLRTVAADYLYYESQTSPFHQADILLMLTACMLLNEESGISLDPRLVPGLGSEMIRLILGDDARIAKTQHKSERLVYEAMEHAHRQLPESAARRLLRELQPLRARLLGAVPAARAQVPGRPGPRMRLHRAVVEIRESVLALRPYVDQQLAGAARTAVHPAELTRAEVAAAVEASVLTAALRARASGAPALAAAGAGKWQHMPGPDLHSEAAWLVRIARAFQDLPNGRCKADAIALTESDRINSSFSSPARSD
jgi:hypothetical protein